MADIVLGTKDAEINKSVLFPNGVYIQVGWQQVNKQTGTMKQYKGYENKAGKRDREWWGEGLRW